MPSDSTPTGVAFSALVSLLVAFGGCSGHSEADPTPVIIRPPGESAPPSFPNVAVSKVDILFDIDNSSSMGDKQQYLQATIPDLIAHLTTPNCVDSQGNAIVADGGPVLADDTGHCAAGVPATVPIRDLHVGVVTSSLGGRGTSSICPTMATPGATPPEYLEYTTTPYPPLYEGPIEIEPEPTIPKNNDDQAHLINRADPPSTPLAATTAVPGDFLAWVPPGASAPADAVTEPTAAQLTADTQGLVVGAQAFGCGIESQLESWYRFLVQPDPYASIVTTTDSQGLLVAAWSGLDTTILQQRADFLRPDSLVLIVVLSDEDDSEIDVRSIGGYGVNWLDNNFQPPRATAQCASDPGSSQCLSCGFSTAPQDDPNCAMGPYPNDPTNWAFNDNLRHVHMKQKYGVDVQFPINRYVLGLASAKVPNRDGEYPPGGDGFYQGGLDNDPTDLNCDNPLFSQNLPTTATGPADPSLCALTPNTWRTPSSNLVYYAHIGGVPQELLTTTDASGNVTPKATLAYSDWVSILGTDPENYNYAGIDPHMIESYQPRAGIPLNTAGSPVGDEAGDWVTDGETPERVNLPVDREYACVFKLTTPRNCDPTSEQNSEADISTCDCSTSGLAADHVPAVCDTQNPLQQDYAKAYPTIRELLLAKKLGPQAIVGSICPIDLVDNAAGNDPLYGYRPAITAIFDRLTGLFQSAQ